MADCWTDPGVGGERGLDTLIWSRGFSKRPACIQALDGRQRLAARFKPAAATACDWVDFGRERVHVSVGGLVYVWRMDVSYRRRWTVQLVSACSEQGYL